MQRSAPLLTLAGILATSFLSPPVGAQTRTWDGGGANASWNTAANWSPDNTPAGLGESALFGASSKNTITMNTNYDIEGITFSAEAGAYVFTLGSGRYLNLASAGIVNASGQTQAFTINGGDFRVSQSGSLGASTRFTIRNDGYLSLYQNAKAAAAVITVKDSGLLSFGVAASDSTDAQTAVITIENGGLVLFNGTSTANQATLDIAGGAAYFNDSSDPANAVITLSDYGRLGFDQRDTPDAVTVGSLSGVGYSYVIMGGRVLRTGDVSTTFGGSLGNYYNDAAGLEKIGAGTLTLSGANPYLNLATTVTSGTLKLGAQGSIPVTPSITIAAGATFDVSEVTGGFTLASGQTLGGSGHVVGTITIADGATLAPGHSPGTLTISGNATWNGGATYVWEINDAAGAAGSAYDLVSISGTLTLAATAENQFTLSLVSLTAGNAAGELAGFDASQNYSYTIASASGGILGFDADKFAINTAGFAHALAGGAWSLAVSGNDLTLNFIAASAIPEPSTYAVLFGLAALTAAAIRRRRLAAPSLWRWRVPESATHASLANCSRSASACTIAAAHDRGPRCRSFAR